MQHQHDPEDEVVDVDPALGDDAARPPGNPRAAHQPGAHADERERADEPDQHQEQVLVVVRDQLVVPEVAEDRGEDGQLQAARIAPAVRRASAMIVIIGLVPEAVGKALASPIQTPGVSCSSPHGLATDVSRVGAHPAAPHLVGGEDDELARLERHLVDARR